MYLFIDTETTGLSKNSDHVVQVAWILARNQDSLSEQISFIIQPDGYSIPQQAAFIHGITTERARREGIPLLSALVDLSKAANQASVVVAHNLSFDLRMLESSYTRVGLSYPFSRHVQICTMKSSTTWCAIPYHSGRSGLKWPKLTELHMKLFGESFVGAHDALADVKACMRCYFKLVERGVIARHSIATVTKQPPRAKASPSSRVADPAAQRTTSWPITVKPSNRVRPKTALFVDAAALDAYDKDLYALVCLLCTSEVDANKEQLNIYIDEFGQHYIDVLRSIIDRILALDFEYTPSDHTYFDSAQMDLIARTVCQRTGRVELYRPLKKNSSPATPQQSVLWREVVELIEVCEDLSHFLRRDGEVSDHARTLGRWLLVVAMHLETTVSAVYKTPNRKAAQGDPTALQRMFAEIDDALRAVRHALERILRLDDAPHAEVAKALRACGATEATINFERRSRLGDASPHV